MHKYKFGYFSGGLLVEERITKSSHIHIGDIYYTSNISKDKDWGTTLKRELLYLIKVNSIIDGKVNIDLIKIKSGKMVIKKINTTLSKLFNFIKIGKVK